MKQEFSKEELKYLKLLSASYPTVQSVYTELINLQAILNLPKGTEHFMSDLHGEYEAFCHIINNCSGVIREKVQLLFGETLTDEERSELCTLIYYPEEKLSRMTKKPKKAWYKKTLGRLIELARLFSSKYTRSRVRAAMPEDYSFILDELLHMQPDEDNNQFLYHEKIIDTLIQIDSGNDFIIALTKLIKNLAVDRLHIVGDIFDRGARPDAIIDMLSHHNAVDIEWGNHDILWMGAAAGSTVCIAAVIRNSLAYGNMEVLESGYGISLRSLMLYASQRAPEDAPETAAMREITAIMFKLESQLIKRHPEFKMYSHLSSVHPEKNCVTIDGVDYALANFPYSSYNGTDQLTPDEEAVMTELQKAFLESERLRRHIEYLYANGSLYKCYNGNLLFHGCIPLTETGAFLEMELNGRRYWGKSYMDYMDRMARRAYFKRDADAQDSMWFLWCGKDSPLCGRTLKTFERAYCADPTTWEEPQNPYYTYHTDEAVCLRILQAFGLTGDNAHIINGHTPIKVIQGERPVKANGRLIVIDGGFCRAYQKTTGIAGYTLIYNSHGLRIMSHQAFSSIDAALSKNKDIHSQSEIFETTPHRMMVSDSDKGMRLKEQIADLERLLLAYRQGVLSPQ